MTFLQLRASAAVKLGATAPRTFRRHAQPTLRRDMLFTPLPPAPPYTPRAPRTVAPVARLTRWLFFIHGVTVRRLRVMLNAHGNLLDGQTWVNIKTHYRWVYSQYHSPGLLNENKGLSTGTRHT